MADYAPGRATAILIGGPHAGLVLDLPGGEHCAGFVLTDGGYARIPALEAESVRRTQCYRWVPA